MMKTKRYKDFGRRTSERETDLIIFSVHKYDNIKIYFPRVE